MNTMLYASGGDNAAQVGTKNHTHVVSLHTMLTVREDLKDSLKKGDS
jgi:predicted small metal-binding protein